MSLATFLLPIDRQYVIATAYSPDDCAAKLKELLAEGKLQGTLTNSKFVLYSKTSWWRRIFQPVFHGEIKAQGDGQANIEFTSSLRKPAALVINTALSSLVGAIIGIIACSYLIRDVLATTYAFIGITLIPLLTAIAAWLFAQTVVPEETKQVLSVMSGSFAEASSPQGLTKQGRLSIEQFAAGILACLLSLGAAYYMHKLAWNYWCDGQYARAEELCRPVAQLTEAFLGSKNAASADCRYYLAECLRCQGPAELRERNESFKEPQAIYEQCLKDMSKSLGDTNPFVGDIRFNLARMYDQTGRHQLADEGYRRVVDDWSRSAEIGPHSMYLARVLDRLAMLCLKEGKFDDAEKFQEQALKIDEEYGEHAGRSIGEDLNDLALVFDRKEDYKTAEDFYQKALDKKIAVVGPGHYSIATTLFNLAEIKQKLGDEKAYKELSGKAYSIWAQVLGPKDRTLPDAMQKYQLVLDLTKPDYEVPHVDTRFDGLRPYLGRP
jgi:tetratricopeptide (TPR) repeat protein